jgi:Na+/H+ antiporter NhaA
MTDDDRTNAMVDAIPMFLHLKAASAILLIIATALAMLLVKATLFRYLHLRPKKLHD